VYVPDSWHDLTDRLPDGGRVVVIGASDSGKTTFTWWLADELSSGGDVALVDADLGQSRIGPPACVGWTTYGVDRGEFEFVGDVQPASRLIAALSGTVRMGIRATRLTKPKWLIVDTGGFVDGPDACEFKGSQVQLLAPATVVALGAPGRLDHLRWAWRGRDEIRWLRLDVAPGCCEKSREHRRAWRSDHFAEWLAGSVNHRFELDHLALHHVPSPEVLAERGPDGLAGTLVGLDDHQGVGICLGLLEDFDMSRSHATVWAPPEAAGARGLRFGALRLNPDGSPLEADAKPCETLPERQS
jgi:polynucleotide 5'-kinase involved in rRNA processing